MSYKASSTVLDRLQDIFYQDDDDFDEPDDALPRRYRRRTDVLDADLLDDYIDREDTLS